MRNLKTKQEILDTVEFHSDDEGLSHGVDYEDNGYCMNETEIIVFDTLTLETIGKVAL